MENRSGTRKMAKTSPPPQISQDDASFFVGSIIEKGMQDEQPLFKPFAPTPPPRPTVLPFPVARHRSHGPHWGPKPSTKGGGSIDANAGVGNEDDEKEGEGITEFESIAAFANPVTKKEKKHIAFSRWRQLSSSDSSVPSHEKEEHRFPSSEFDERKKNGEAIEFADTVSCKQMETNVELPEPRMKIEEGVVDNSGRGFPNSTAEASPNKQKGSTLSVPSSTSSNFESDHGSTSLESQIDAANRAQLQGMSPDEIAEKRAEIMEKVAPTLVKVLQKRGQDKLNKQESSRSDFSSISKSAQSENQLNGNQKDLAHIKGDPSHGMKTTTAPRDTKGTQDDGVPKMTLAYSNLWNAWNERVEAVRRLRFSFDGTVIENDLAGIPESGDISGSSGYNADNVTERDFLRTEGDPGAVGYTIKEAVALTRSVVPGQRALALHLLAAVLDKALSKIHQNQVGNNVINVNEIGHSIDWEAVWAFALGPEPKLVLSVRMCLDDNNNSVVLACVKVIQSMLSCEMNENYFNILEKIAPYEKDVCIAPVFRTRPDIDVGFLHGGFWKYNAKPSNILPFDEDITDDETEEKHTIQDDVVFSGQDIAAGLVRMGILPRFCYLLEADPAAALEECIISILIAIARHSPTCADAIRKCQRLVQTVVNRFNMKRNMEIYPSMVKSVILLKVLARYDRKICLEFVENGIFQDMTCHLYQYVISLEQWLRKGRENCKLASALMVEQLRLWKVCIQFGYCVSWFADFFPALCLWLHPPTFEKLIEHNVLSEFADISKEAYLLLGALGKTLPNFQKYQSNQNSEFVRDDLETWSWSHVFPMIDLAMKWIVAKKNPCMCKFFEHEKETNGDFGNRSPLLSPILWAFSSVMHMLSCVLERLIPENTINVPVSGGKVPCLPEFVSRVGLEIIKNGFLSFSDVKGIQHGTDPQGGSFIAQLCHLRRQSDHETSLASVSFLHGSVQVIAFIDKLIELARSEVYSVSSNSYSSAREGQILENGIINSSRDELKSPVTTFMNLVTSEWHYVQAVEIFGRGGPAPGVGLGWGSPGGGFWSISILLAQIDARVLLQLLEVLQIATSKHLPQVEEITFNMESINAVMGVCLTLGPRDEAIMEKALDILFQVPVLKQLDLCSRQYFHIKRGIKSLGWEYVDEDYLRFGKILASHFRNRWLCVKKKKRNFDQKPFKKGSNSLDTIHEDVDTSNVKSQDHCQASLVVQWAHQKLPLPLHWFLSPISTIQDSKQALVDFHEVAKGGLFFLLVIEGMSCFLSANVHSPVQQVPLIWKLHSLSVILLTGMDVLEEEKSRDVYEALQEVYGQFLDELWYNKHSELIVEKNDSLLENGRKDNVEFLRFQAEIHESYPTFIETVVEQFAAISYGDQIFSRQVAIYLHRHVEAQVRLSTWDALSNAHVLELLPPLEKCLAEAEGYLEPVEDDELILEAYVKSWTSGALDRAAVRGSVTFTLALHHLSSFIFQYFPADMSLLRSKLVKSLLRDYSRKQQHEGMMLNLIQYWKPSAPGKPEPRGDTVEMRFELLMEACEGNSSLLREVEKLRYSFSRRQIAMA